MLSRVLAAVLLFVIVLTASPACAGGAAGGEVSKREYRRVHAPMRMGKVHRIFDTAGQSLQASRTHQTRVYRGWRPSVQVYVRFRRDAGRWVMVSKMAESSVVVA